MSYSFSEDRITLTMVEPNGGREYKLRRCDNAVTVRNGQVDSGSLPRRPAIFVVVYNDIVIFVTSCGIGGKGTGPNLFQYWSPKNETSALYKSDDSLINIISRLHRTSEVTLYIYILENENNKIPGGKEYLELPRFLYDCAVDENDEIKKYQSNQPPRIKPLASKQDNEIKNKDEILNRTVPRQVELYRPFLTCLLENVEGLRLAEIEDECARKIVCF